MNGTSTPDANGSPRPGFGTLLPWLLGVLGGALVGYGAYIHLSVAAQTNCDGCAPWHPLFVVTPLVLGGLLLVSAAVLRYRA